jgi:hypothetical protein
MVAPDLDVLKHQYEFIADTDHKFLGLVGGYRSGKTYALCIKALQLANLNSELPGIISEPTYGMLNRVLIPTMNGLLYKLGILFNLSKSEGYYDISFNGIEKRIWLLSGENYERAAGISASYFLMDEIDLMKKEVARNAFNMFASRLTRGECMQGCCCSTPEGFNFLYEFFEENKDTDRILYRGSTYDNPFIDKSYFETMAKTHTSNQLEAYLKGYFVNLTTGQVYYAFDRKSNSTNLTLNDWHPSHAIHCGVDFNVNKMACTIGMLEEENLYFVDEIIGCRNTDHLVTTLQERFPGRTIIVYPDASGSAGKTSASESDIAKLKAAGFLVQAKNKNPPVKDRVSSFNTKLCNAQGKRSLFVNIQNCPHLVKGLEQQGYDTTGAPDKSTGLDHALDAAGYLVHFLFPVIGKATATVH